MKSGHLWKKMKRCCSNCLWCWSVRKTKCQCKKVQRSKRGQSNIANKAQSSAMIIAGFRKARYNGEETWSGIDTSTRLIQKKNRHKDRMQGESKFLSPLIIGQCRNNIFTKNLSCCSASSVNVQYDYVKVSNGWSMESRKNLSFHEKL